VRSVLVIAPYFAQAAVGAYRSVKLARYLGAQGFRPIVLAGTFPGEERDPSTARALPANVMVRDAYVDPAVAHARAALDRARSLGQTARSPRRSPSMNPARAALDRYALHAPRALAEAIALAREHAVSLVYASLGPLSAGPVAIATGAAIGRPVVLDLRDPFSLHEAGANTPGIAARLRTSAQSAIEAMLFARAERVVLNTEAARTAYVERFPFLEAKALAIPNAFDHAPELEAERDAQRSERLRVLHLGAFREGAPLVDLATGLARLARRRGLTPGEVAIVHHGSWSDSDAELIRDLGIEPFVRTEARLPYYATRPAMRAANLLVLPHAPNVTLRVPAKAYDYAGAGAPVLSISDNAAIDAILAHHPESARVRPGHIDAIAQALEVHLDRAATRPETPRFEAPEALHARTMTRRMAEVFREAIRAFDARGSGSSRGAPSDANPTCQTIRRGTSGT
jgi:hypothetical protein